MWEIGNFWAEGKSSTPMASSYLAVMHEIHVLLVDHESESLLNTAKLLELCQYRVTLVELASAAITMLSSGKVKFDMVMANVNSPDLHGFKLLQQAVNMDIPIILMSVDDNALMAMRAIEGGAYLYVKKPATTEMLRCIWQNMMREKLKMMRERDRLIAGNYSARGVEFRDVINENPNMNFGGNMFMNMRDKGKSKKIIRGRKGEEEYDSENHMMANNKIKRKVCTEWTQELHEKFMEAVEQLGEGRCFPKEILELMNVPGLTRMQVASHLQKCRNDNWRSPEERKSSLNAVQHVSSDTDGSQHKPRRFGSMPRLGKAPSYHEASGPGEGSKSTQSATHENDGGVNNENENNINNNMGSGAIMGGNASSGHQQHQHYGSSSVVAHPSASHIVVPGTNSSNPRDDFFTFPDMDCLIQNFSGLPQGSAGMMLNNLNSASAADYHYYHDQQNSKVPNMDDKSQWSSDTSNFGSDDSDTRGP